MLSPHSSHPFLTTVAHISGNAYSNLWTVWTGSWRRLSFAYYAQRVSQKRFWVSSERTWVGVEVSPQVHSRWIYWPSKGFGLEVQFAPRHIQTGRRSWSPRLIRLSWPGSTVWKFSHRAGSQSMYRKPSASANATWLDNSVIFVFAYSAAPCLYPADFDWICWRSSNLYLDSIAPHDNRAEFIHMEFRGYSVGRFGYDSLHVECVCQVHVLTCIFCFCIFVAFFLCLVWDFPFVLSLFESLWLSPSPFACPCPCLSLSGSLLLSLSMTDLFLASLLLCTGDWTSCPSAPLRCDCGNQRAWARAYSSVGRCKEEVAEGSVQWSPLDIHRPAAQPTPCRGLQAARCCQVLFPCVARCYCYKKPYTQSLVRLKEYD